MMFYEHWKDAEAAGVWDKNRWPNFSVKEVAQRGDGWEDGETPVLIVPGFIDRVQMLRYDFGKPIHVNSWYRSPSYNALVSHSGSDGPHTTGRAVDIRVSGKGFYKLLKVVMYLEYFTGLGINQKGLYRDRFIHIDDLEDDGDNRTRPVGWSY